MADFLSPSPLGTANMIRRALADVGRRLRALRIDDGISPSKLSLLGRLQRAGRPMTATELATIERLQPQSLTRIIADLEDHGFIVRYQRESDRRQLAIELTEAGSALIRHHARAQNEWLVEAMEQRLTQAERAILVLAADLLDRMADHETGEAATAALAITETADQPS